MKKGPIHMLSAIEAGIAGALSITAVTAVIRFLGVPVNLEMFLGTFVGIPPGNVAWIVGLGIHCAFGALFGIAYAAIFEAGLIAQTRPRAVGLGVIHAIVAGIAIRWVAELHPAVPGTFDNPGYFYSDAGWPGVVLFIGFHVLYGAFAASLYRVDEATDENEVDWMAPAA